MRTLLATLLLCSAALAHEVPATVTMPNGEVLYVTGHDCTDVTAQSGDWLNPETWEDGTVPTIDDNVCIKHGHTVRMHGDMWAKNIVCEGGLEWLEMAFLRVSTITGLHDAKWFAGTEDFPVHFLISFFSVPFEPGDTGQFANGIVWSGHNSIEIHGVVNGPVWEKCGDEYKVNTSNCGVCLQHVEGDIKPHFMVMHGSGYFRGVHIDGFGRTDKSKLLSATNPAGRYALHFHRGGEEMVSTVEDCVSTGSPGWGIVNHSSNVVATGCAVADFYGAGFVCEAANEVGGFVDCLAIDGHSVEQPAPYLRQIAQDRWHSGEGFVGAAKVAIHDCVAADVGVGFAWWNRGLQEVIAGVERTAAYSDADTLNMAQVPQSGMQVHGYSLRGLSVWNTAQKHNYTDSLYAEFSDFVLTGGGPTSIGISQSYSGNCRFSDGVIDGAKVAVRYENQAAWHEYVRLNISNVTDGFYNNSTAGGAWRDCKISATRCALPFIASQHQNNNGVWEVSGTTLDAPLPYELVYNPDQSKWDALYVNNPAGPVTNELWINGEQILWPWQE